VGKKVKRPKLNIIHLILGFSWVLILLGVLVYIGCIRPGSRQVPNNDQEVVLPPPENDPFEEMLQNRAELISQMIKEDSITWEEGPMLYDWKHPLVPIDSTCGYPRLRMVYVDYYWKYDKWRALEMRYYESGRIIPMISSDRGFQPTMPGCESLVLKYDFVTESYECILHSERPNFIPALDQLSTFDLTLPQADSVLASWGLTRQWPIEEWEEEYINGQK
jgi:hypothetical protein